LDSTSRRWQMRSQGRLGFVTFGMFLSIGISYCNHSYAQARPEKGKERQSLLCHHCRGFENRHGHRAGIDERLHIFNSRSKKPIISTRSNPVRKSTRDKVLPAQRVVAQTSAEMRILRQLLVECTHKTMVGC